MPEETAAIEGSIAEEEFVDLDLDAEDVHLREAIREPMVTKMGGKVISIPHMLDWEHEDTRLANVGDFDGWAKGVMTERDYEVFRNAHLRNYQIERIIEKASKRSGTNPGKSSRSSNSRRSTGRR